MLSFGLREDLYDPNHEATDRDRNAGDRKKTFDGSLTFGKHLNRDHLSVYFYDGPVVAEYADGWWTDPADNVRFRLLTIEPWPPLEEL